MFTVKEVFYTIQGEGAQAGRPAVFCRFAGCNGWSGFERDRAKGPFPCSRWCDTVFTGGRKVHEDNLIEEILSGYTMHWQLGVGFVLLGVVLFAPNGLASILRASRVHG